MSMSLALGLGLPFGGAGAASSAPVNTVAPSIAGSVVGGDMLTATPGTWTGASSVTGAWYRDGVIITDNPSILPLTGLLYETVPADLTHSLTYVETAVGAGGSATQASNAIGSIVKPGTTNITFPAALPNYALWDVTKNTLTQSAGRLLTLADTGAGAVAATLSPVAAGAGYQGPLVMTDLWGNTFLRFEGDCALTNVAQYVTASTNNTWGIFVVRIHRMNQSQTNTQTQSLLSVNANTGSAVSLMNCGVGTVNKPNYPQMQSFSASADVNAPNLVAGAQLQVVGVFGRNTANGGPVLFINNQHGSGGAGFGNTPSPVTGVEIGRNMFSNEGVGNCAFMDLYYVATGQGATTTLSNMTTLMADATAKWVPQAITGQIIGIGDSLMQGLFQVAALTTLSSGETLMMKATHPGRADKLPGYMRAINAGQGGAQTTQGVTQRDFALGVGSLKLTGGVNKIAILDGYNNIVGTGGNVTASVCYSTSTTGYVQLLHTTTTGWMERGFEVGVITNPMNNVTATTKNQTRISDPTNINGEGVGLREKFTDYAGAGRAFTNPQFLTDTLSGNGGANQGKLSTVPFDLITVSAATIVQVVGDCSNATYYWTDGLHLRAPSYEALWTGADTPAYGLRAFTLAA